MRSNVVTRFYGYSLLSLMAVLSLESGCVQAEDSLPREDPFTTLPREDYRYQMPDGRIAVGTGIRNGDTLLIEGDMLIPLTGGKGSPSAAVTSNLWPSKVIVYEFDSAVGATTRQQVLNAMNPWKSAGFIFRQRTTQTSYVRITTEYFSQYPWICAVGTIGYQAINTYYAGRNCRMRDFVHEWGHILGLFHEHQRIDRDQFVTVNVDRIGGTIAGMGQDWGVYDFGSIMHYDAYDRNSDGSINYNQVLIRPRDGRPLSSFGWNETPSAQDLSAVSSLYANRLPGVPLYQTYNAQYHDYFYTISPSERDIAIQYYGYYNYGVAARVEPASEGGTTPFWRFYKWLPQTDHFYPTSQYEYDYVTANGWQYEGIEGYVFTSQVEGTTPLFRFSHWDPSTSDLMHYYTVNGWERYSLESQGWGYDGIAGYVYGP